MVAPMITEFLRSKFDPSGRSQANLDRFILIRETTERERAINHGRLPNRLWLVLFPNAGAAQPFAIVQEWDDGRPAEDVIDDHAEVSIHTLDFWWDTGRRMGDH